MIEVSGIKKRYGKRWILDDISFQANCGESIAVVGCNGCGKTTLMQILAGILSPDAGNIRYFGKDTLKNSTLYRKFCGYVPQELPLLSELSVKDNLRLWNAHHGEAYHRIIQQFELSELMNVTVSKLSGGMKRRLSIACALAEWPPILLLDEPVTALDLYYKESIEQWIQEYKKMNGIVIMTTHDEHEILTSDRCLLMKDGRLTEVSKDLLTIDFLKNNMK